MNVLKIFVVIIINCCVLIYVTTILISEKIKNID